MLSRNPRPRHTEGKARPPRLRAYGSACPERTRSILRESSTLVPRTLSTKSRIANGLSVSARIRANRAVRTTHSLPRRCAFVPRAPFALSPPLVPFLPTSYQSSVDPSKRLVRRPHVNANKSGHHLPAACARSCKRIDGLQASQVIRSAHRSVLYGKVHTQQGAELLGLGCAYERSGDAVDASPLVYVRG